MNVEHVVEHERWSRRTVTLVCGPPGAGKSTLAAQLHPSVLELESFAHLSDDHRLRLRAFGRMCSRIGRAPAPDYAVVRCAATQAERQHHERLVRPSRTVVLLTPLQVCIDRITARGRPNAAAEVEAARQWWHDWDADHAA